MATIFDIKHFAVHDGPGIRTTVFFKGCPLRCVWCHNPESFSGAFQLAYSEEKCMGCRKCEDVCASGVHLFSDAHTLDIDKCTYCGRCEKACSSSALTIYGREVTVPEILPEILEDKDFYGENGGVTLSGGECLIQADFCAELLRELKKEGIHTAVDTSGYVSKEAIDRVAPYTDLFLYDIKAYEEDVHIRCTGRSNKIILENLMYLEKLGKKIEVRIPLVPGYNDCEIKKIGEFLSGFNCVTCIRVLAYHKYAQSKYVSLGINEVLPENIPEKEDVIKAEQILESFGLVCK